MADGIKIELGYLCLKGHFQFKGDPEGNSCGTKDIGTIYVEINEWADPEEFQEIVDEALASLHRKIEFWRKGA